MYVKFSSVCRDLNICFSSVLRNKHLVPSPKECFVCNICFFPAWAPLIGFTGYSFEVWGDSVVLHHRRFKFCVGHSGKRQFLSGVNLADNCKTFSSEQNYEWMGFEVRQVNYQTICLVLIGTCIKTRGWISVSKQVLVGSLVEL